MPILPSVLLSTAPCTAQVSIATLIPLRGARTFLHPTSNSVFLAASSPKLTALPCLSTHRGCPCQAHCYAAVGAMRPLFSASGLASYSNSISSETRPHALVRSRTFCIHCLDRISPGLSMTQDIRAVFDEIRAATQPSQDVHDHDPLLAHCRSRIAVTLPS